MSEYLKFLSEDERKEVLALGAIAESLESATDVVNLFGRAAYMVEQSTKVADLVARIALEREAVFFANAFAGKETLSKVATKFGFAGSGRDTRAGYTLAALRASTLKTVGGQVVTFSTFLTLFSRNQGIGVGYASIKDAMALDSKAPGALNTQKAVYDALQSAYRAKQAEKQAKIKATERAIAQAAHDLRVKEAEAKGLTPPKMPAMLVPKPPREATPNGAALRRIGNACDTVVLDNDLQESYIPAITAAVAMLEALKTSIVEAVAKQATVPATTEAVATPA